MTSLKPLSWPPSPALRRLRAPATRRLAAAVLRRASALLVVLARRLSVPPMPALRDHPSVLEYHADAGAPEGALYVDGKLVGWVAGVRRL